MSTGLNFMGWEDSLRVLRDGSTLQFSLHKTMHGHDLLHYLYTVWRVYTDTELYTKVILGGRARANVDVLQQLSPHMAIVTYHERYDGAKYTVHALNLNAAVQTPEGMVYYMRSIDVPQVQRAFESARGLWIHKVAWKSFDVLDHTVPRTSCAFRVSLRGTLQGQDTSFLRLRLFEVLGLLTRFEALATGRRLLQCD